jgi:geranyl-CoA carboxylase beta subunit
MSFIGVRASQIVFGIDLVGIADLVAAMEAAVVAQFDKESHPLAATAKLYDDGLIDPRDTRAVLSKVLAVCREAEAREPHKMQFSVARP